jgi:hypothetical protein
MTTLLSELSQQPLEALLMSLDSDIMMTGGYAVLGGQIWA